LGAHHARFYVHSEWIAKDLKSFGGEHGLLSFLISMLRPGDDVYDVGANMGIHAVFLGQAVGARGHIEPETHYCERRRANVALNGLSNVRIVPLALGDRSYASELLPSVRGFASPRLAEPSQAGICAPGSQKVQVVERDRLVEIESLPLPRLAKIDIEGHEYAVIRGLRRTLANSACRRVCCEVHPRLLPEGLNPEEILNLLKSCGFTRFDVLPRLPEHHVGAFKE
jgi:FkbM family methyltransferase